jgi:hypothetical protein
MNEAVGARINEQARHRAALSSHLCGSPRRRELITSPLLFPQKDLPARSSSPAGRKVSEFFTGREETVPRVTRKPLIR